MDGEASMTEQLITELMAALNSSSGLEKAVENIVEKAVRFNGRNATWFLHAYKAEMLLQGIPDTLKLSTFNRLCTSTLQTQIAGLQVTNDTQSEFKEGLLNAFSLDDLSRVTRRVFADWVASNVELV